MADRWEFANANFRRGEKQLLCNIQRRKAPSSPPRQSPPPPANLADALSLTRPGDNTRSLAEENERLRRENSALARELQETKGFLDGIQQLVSHFNADQDGKTPAIDGPAEAEAEASTRLFGVAIGCKRPRDCRFEAQTATGHNREK